MRLRNDLRLCDPPKHEYRSDFSQGLLMPFWRRKATKKASCRPFRCQSWFSDAILAKKGNEKGELAAISLPVLFIVPDTFCEELGEGLILGCECSSLQCFSLYLSHTFSSFLKSTHRFLPLKILGFPLGSNSSVVQR